MEEIPIISDVHGNLEALKKVLEDIDRRKINQTICLGDIIAKGTNMHECLKLIRKKCQIVIKGNCEEYYSDNNIDVNKLSKLRKKRREWIREKFSNEELAYIQSLPFCYEMYISGRLVRMFHAHPNETDIHVGNIDKLENIYSIFLPSENTITQAKADVVLYGHSHMQYMQKLYNRTAINVGSVGNPIDVFRNIEKDGNIKNTINANYFIIKGKINSRDYDAFSYEFVNIPYDIEKEITSNKDNVDFKDYEKEIRYGKYRNMDSLENSFIKRGIDINKI